MAEEGRLAESSGDLGKTGLPPLPFYASAPGSEPTKAIHLPRNICPMWTYDGNGTAEGFRSTNPVERIWRGIPSVEP